MQNWKTTLSSLGTACFGLLAFISALPAQLGPAADLIPPDYRAKLILAAALAAAVSHALHGAFAQDAAPSSASSSKAPLTALLFWFAMGMAANSLLTACATNTGNASKDRAGRVTNALLQNAADLAGQVAFETIINTASDAAAGEKIDFAHAAAEGLWTSAPSILSATDLSRVIDAWSGGTLPAVTDAAVSAYHEAQPQTAAQTTVFVNRLAQAISTAALDAHTAISQP